MSHIDIPLWAVPIIVAIFGFLFGYIWKTLNDRIKALERSEEEMLKKKAEEGAILTLPIHDAICERVHASFEKTLVEKLEQMEKTFALMIKVQILEALRDYDLGQGFKGRPGIQGLKGDKGDKGDR